MAEKITLTIDGQECVGEQGMTVLEVAKANDVDIPVLCHHPWLSNRGACRMCVVEVEGNRRLVTSCAAPAEDGMVVTAHNERLSTLRQMTLELLFAERNHICPYCAMTGVCELQSQAYRHGITHTRYAYLFPVLEPDTSNDYFVQDHNRCILCGRCVRACAEVAGVGCLDFGFRGTAEAVVADLGVPLGESSCVSCGTCVDVCPTGSLFEKRAPYFSRGTDLERRPVVCPDDDLGCMMNVVLKSGLIARVQGWEEAPVNGPLLSESARYRILDEPTPRLLKPRMRNEQGQLVEVEWDEAIAAAAQKLAAAAAAAPVDGTGSPLAGLASGRLPKETLEAFHTFISDTCQCPNVDTFRNELRHTRRAASDIYGAHTECGFDAIQDADLVILVGIDPPRSHQVLQAWLLRKRHHEQCPIIVINTRQSEMREVVDLVIKPRRDTETRVIMGLLCQLLDAGGLSRRVDRETEERWRSQPAARVAVEAGIDANDLVKAAQMYAAAKKPVVLYGPELTHGGDPTAIGLMWDMARLSGHLTGDGALRVRGFELEANAAAAEEIGYRGADLDNAEAVYMLAGDDPFDPSGELDDLLEAVPTLIVQASHEGPLLRHADIVLPSLKWSERGGTWINATGLRQTCEASTLPPAGILADEDVLARVREQVTAVMQEATNE